MKITDVTLTLFAWDDIPVEEDAAADQARIHVDVAPRIAHRSVLPL